MAHLTKQTFASRVASALRVSADTTRIDEIKSLIDEELISMWYSKPWTFARGTGNIQTTAVKSAGTISIATSTTAVVGSGTAFATGDVGSFLYAGTWSNPLEVTAFTDTTNITVDIHVGTAAISADTYTLVKDTYTLPSDFYSVRVSMEPDRSADITWLGEEQFKNKYPLPSATGGNPEFAAIIYTDATTVPSIRFHPSPSTAKLIPVYYHKTLTLPGDSTAMPVPHLAEIYLMNQVMALAHLRIRQDPVMYQVFAPVAMEKFRQLTAAYSGFQEQLLFEYDGMGRHQRETLMPT